MLCFVGFFVCLSNCSLHIVFVLCCLCFGGLDSCVLVGDLVLVWMYLFTRRYVVLFMDVDNDGHFGNFRISFHIWSSKSIGKKCRVMPKTTEFW
jgi:hypothetical protein